MSKYRWPTPHQWLLDKAETMTVEELHGILRDVAWRLDGDSILDLFQDEMERDGYFTELPPTKPTARELL